MLNEEIISVINDPNSIKAVTTTDPDGIPHTVFKQSLKVNENGYIEYSELVETSITNKNMVHSIWFNRKVAIAVILGDVSYQIMGIPYRALIHGREFERRYSEVKETSNIDLSTVWLIKVDEVREESLLRRIEEEKKQHPILGHLDFITRKQ